MNGLNSKKRMGLFNNIYTIKSKFLTEVLTDLEELTSMIEVFKEKHPYYNYNTQISQTDDMWVATVKLNTYAKSKNIKTS
jgi:ribosomal protein L31